MCYFYCLLFSHIHEEKFDSGFHVHLLSPLTIDEHPSEVKRTKLTYFLFTQLQSLQAEG